MRKYLINAASKMFSLAEWTGENSNLIMLGWWWEAGPPVGTQSNKPPLVSQAYHLLPATFSSSPAEVSASCHGSVSFRVAWRLGGTWQGWVSWNPAFSCCRQDIRWLALLFLALVLQCELGTVTFCGHGGELRKCLWALFDPKSLVCGSNNEW